MYWSDDGVAYVLSGPSDKDRLNQVARLVYDQNEKAEKNGG
jgi:anti-sigma factor RsiW